MAKTDSTDSNAAVEYDLADVIRDLGHGATNKLGSTRMREILKACRQNPGKKGALQLQIAMVATPDGLVEMRASLSTKKPEPAIPGGAYYVTDDCGLVTEDPRQASLPLAKTVPAARIVNITDGGKAQ